MKLYPVVGFITDEELKNVGGNPSLDLEHRMAQKRHIRAISTGEKRCPKKREWFLSGAIVEAYKAPNDLTTPYHIAKLVMTETKTVTTTKIISPTT